MAFFISASVKLPMPVSMSGVMFDAVPEKFDVSNESPPDRSRELMGNPSAFLTRWASECSAFDHHSRFGAISVRFRTRRAPLKRRPPGPALLQAARSLGGGEV